MADFITCNTVTLAGHHYLLLWICCYESSTWPYGASAPRRMLVAELSGSYWSYYWTYWLWLGHFLCCLSNILCDYLWPLNISISMHGNFIASMSAFITKSTVAENDFMMRWHSVHSDVIHSTWIIHAYVALLAWIYKMTLLWSRVWPDLASSSEGWHSACW